MKLVVVSFVLLAMCLPGCQTEPASTLPVLHGDAAGDAAGNASGPPESLPGESAPVVQMATATGGLSVLAWNVESGGSDPKVIASQLNGFRGLDIVVLTEVLPTEFQNFRSAIHAGENDAGENAGYESIDSRSGDEDRIQVIFNKNRLDLLQSGEPNEMGGMPVNTGRHRSPLVCLFQDRVSGEKFYIVAVHLARGNAEFRKQQSIAIREWARQRLEAVVLIGDLNFDYVFADDRGNEAFEELQRDSVLTWVRPVELIDSNWFDGNGDGADEYPGSLLDGVYVSGPAKAWRPVCRVLVREGDFPDNDRTSDHRAISLELVPAIPGGGK